MALTDGEIAETLRSLVDAFNRGDYEAAIEFAHPEGDGAVAATLRTARELVIQWQSS